MNELINKVIPYIKDERLFNTMLIVLIAVASFGLGRQSVAVSPASESRVQPVAPIDRPIESVPVIKSDDTAMYVASKNGSAYHLLHCPGAKQISEENKIFFSSKDEAERAGYRPAANCKGI